MLLRLTVYMYAHAYGCMYEYVDAYARKQQLCVRTHVCTFVHSYVCMSVYMHVCMHIRMYVHAIFMHVCTHVHTFALRMYACVYNMCTNTGGYLGHYHYVSMNLRAFNAFTHRMEIRATTYTESTNISFPTNIKQIMLRNETYKSSAKAKCKILIYPMIDTRHAYVIKPCTKRYHPLTGSRPNTYVHNYVRNRPTPV
jgi:hypothetical protein